MSKNKLILLIIICLFSKAQLIAQDKNTEVLSKKISLVEVLDLARYNSLDALKAKQQYGANYWKYKSFKSSLLPKMDFRTEPFSFNRLLVKRYNSVTNEDVFREQQSLSSYFDVTVTQNIGVTGTRLFVKSSFERLMNTGGGTNTINYNVMPIRIGLQQPLMAFNKFKWEKKIAPLEFQKAQKSFIYDLQNINPKTVNLFFNWALANKQLSIAEENKKSAEKLFKIGEKRYDLGSIERNDLLNLELDVYNAKTKLIQAQQLVNERFTALNLFLRGNLSNTITPQLPELIPHLQIDVNTTLRLASQNNPEMLDNKLRKQQSLRDLDEIIKENRFDLSITASYGLNQQADNIRNAYNNLLDQQIVGISFTIPLLDWGERKGKIHMAKMNNEVIHTEIEKKENTLKQQIVLNVNKFNLQEKLVKGALKTSQIARESYEITQKRFLLGNLDYLQLNASRKSWQSAEEQYIQSLLNYWQLYYEVQKSSLFDFFNNKPLQEDFEKLMNNM